MRVELENVGKRFGRVKALRDLTLELASGSRTALIGPNGSGKSTLTRVLMGMLDYEGRVRLDGLSPRDDRELLQKDLAYVPQLTPRLAAPVAEITRGVAALRGLETATVADLCAKLDLDLGSVARRPFRDLSGGMRQKLLIALALASRPRLLILDEPTASLDPRARQRFFELVEGLPERPTVILCSHRLEEIRHLVDQVVMLADGRLAFFGPAAAYLSRCSGGIVEVLVGDEAAAGWLAESGFRHSASGWWTRWLRDGERVQVLREMTDACGPALRDIVVRDLESIVTPETRSS